MLTHHTRAHFNHTRTPSRAHQHCNWGLNTDTGINLYSPGKVAKNQSAFVAFTAALMHAFKNYPEALRASVATSGNDHRLGADEAPPAIFSIYLGEHLGKHFDAVAAGGPLAGYVLRFCCFSCASRRSFITQAIDRTYALRSRSPLIVPRVRSPAHARTR